jgi:squalene-associated FAD-dependent desaturase
VKHVVVIGGGFAGLAAAVELAARGVRVTLNESRPHLGGRAYSFADEASGEVVDNGQHAMMGCYTQTLAFLEQIGAAGKVVRQRNLRVDMRHPQRGSGAIACTSLPSPLHLLAGVLRYRLLSVAERMRALLGGLQVMAMRRRHDARLEEWTVEQLLRAAGQSPNAQTSFWNPVAIATMNESPQRAAAAPFAEVLARAFFRSREDSQFVLPAVGLSDLYTGDAERFVQARGGCIDVKATVAGLSVSDTHVTGVRRRDGSVLPADGCISTVPPKALPTLLPDALRDAARFQRLVFDVSPIVSTHLWLDRPVLDSEFVGLLNSTTHWVFNRTKLTAQANGNGHQCLSAVISAGHDVVQWDNARITDTVVGDLKALIPDARQARLLRAIVVKEKHATISPTPAAERLRPTAETPLDNFMLAGDWTRTGLPPTIESAVVSGRHAAALLAERLVGH